MRTLALVLLSLAALPASAQVVATFNAGAAEFDLSGTGSATVIDARAAWPLARVLTVEGGLGFSRTGQQFGDVSYLLPSAELQLGLPVGRVRPFASAGVGAFLPLNSYSSRTVVVDGVQYVVDFSPGPEAALVLGVGLDADVTDRVLVRLAGRVRGTVEDGPDFFTGTFAEVTGGVGYRL